MLTSTNSKNTTMCQHTTVRDPEKFRLNIDVSEDKGNGNLEEIGYLRVQKRIIIIF